MIANDGTGRAGWYKIEWGEWVGGYSREGITLDEGIIQHDDRPPIDIGPVSFTRDDGDGGGGGGPVLATSMAAVQVVSFIVGEFTAAEDEKQYRRATVRCYSADGTLVSTNAVVLDPGTAGGGIDPIVLRDRARARIVIEDPPAGSNPPLDDPSRYGIVHIETWLWLEPSYWVQTTEAESQGGVTVTVTATPLTATWTPGDGAAVVCTSPGVPWQSGMPEGATDCSHTYTSSSADLPDTSYNLGVAVEWEFTWTLNGAPQGPFGTVTVTDSFPYRVGEIQALETRD